MTATSLDAISQELEAVPVQTLSPTNSDFSRAWRAFRNPSGECVQADFASGGAMTQRFYS